MRNGLIILALVIVVALPFLLQQRSSSDDWYPGDPVLVIISPHNEAIRYEFAKGFSRWHRRHFGTPVRIDWRNIGGTTEIMRYLASEYVTSFRGWWKRDGHSWPALGGPTILDRRFDPATPPTPLDTPQATRNWQLKCDMHATFRNTDDPAAFGCGIDLFFGGGVYDHGKAAKQGLTVEPWTEEAFPTHLFESANGQAIIPETMKGESWRSTHYMGSSLSTFGICYNRDRITELGIEAPPSQWTDLANPAYAGQLGVADPTKSGSIAKAFEMIIHQQCHKAVAAAGYSAKQTARFEEQIRAARRPPGEMPDAVPRSYQQAIEDGWMNGILLIQRIGANARYFTDAASKVPIDVSMGNAAAGLAIDFYGRYQAEITRSTDGIARMHYITPMGGSGVSADPISLLRGAGQRELAVRFIEYILGAEAQKLWNYAPGAPEGPEKFALRRLPIRRDFYPADDEFCDSAYDEHKPFFVDDLGSDAVNPYCLATQFTYYPRWTASHFNVHRNLIRSMCLDAGEELREAWREIRTHGGLPQNAAALRQMQRMPDRPEPLTWTSAMRIPNEHNRIDYMREWTVFFRQSYRDAARIARENAP